MPGVVPRTSTYALTGVTLPYLLNIANKGVKKALLEDERLLPGLNTYDGKVTYENVAESFLLEYYDARTLLDQD